MTAVRGYLSTATTPANRSADDASQFSDEFDAWALDRDAMIAKRLADAYYNKYYDQDIYGADDLNGYGDWVYTQDIRLCLAAIRLGH